MLTRIYKNCFSFQVVSKTVLVGVTVTFLTFPSDFHSFWKCRDIIFSLSGPDFLGKKSETTLSVAFCIKPTTSIWKKQLDTQKN